MNNLMNHYLILLTISYSLLFLLLVWMWFNKKLSVKGKIALSLLLPFLYYFHWHGLQESKGWPSDQHLPSQFELISADVVEPNQLKEVLGNIHLWVRPNENESPRAYVLPYTRALHSNLHKAKTAMSHGRTQIGLLFDGSSRERGANIGGGMKLQFRNAPRRRLPPKK
ncbi:MAG: hypothetical protein V3U71_07860 [Cocleimonas sp.]